jgi:hypothetical protein
MKKNENNKKRERRTKGRKENCEKNKSNQSWNQWRKGIDQGTSVKKKSNYIDYFVRRPRGLKKE